ncbi:MAG TPA: oligosaccharide flippase family protein [Nevskiaceae bacterium]|nr:oligosaccharide flippase family protein [Nevskiaceae bacterium]
MLHIKQWVRRSTFLRHNLIFFVGSVAVGALNYLYYPVLGRLLTPSSFGEVQALISLFLQIAIFLSVLGLVTINVVANYQSSAKRNAVVLEFERLALCISLVLLLLTIIFQRQLQRFLQFDTTWPFILLIVALVVSVPFTFRGAYLRGKQRFGLASTVNILGAGGKLLFSTLLVAISWGTAGAIGGLIVAQVVACGFAALWAYQNGLHQPEHKRPWRLPDMRVLAPELRYGLLVLVGSLVITLQYSVDVVVIKHYFDPHTAGLYAGIASVARIIFFLTASISLVLMPMVRLDAKPGANRQLLMKSLVLLAAAGLPALLVFTLAPAWITGLLMGHEYTSMASLLPLLSLTLFIVSVLNLIVSYYLALRRYAIALVVSIGAAVTYGLIIAHHNTVRAVVASLLIGSIAMLLTLAIWVGGTKLKEE